MAMIHGVIDDIWCWPRGVIQGNSKCKLLVVSHISENTNEVRVRVQSMFRPMASFFSVVAKFTPLGQVTPQMGAIVS